MLRRGHDPLTAPFDLSAWERVRAMVDFLNRNGVEVRRFLARDAGKVAPGKVLDFRSPRSRLHAKAYLFTGADGEFDRDRLRSLLDRLRWLDELWAERGDPRAQVLLALLEKLPKTNEHGLPTEVALFTSYRDTAEHQFRQLGGKSDDLKTSFRVRSNLADGRWMALLTGNDNRQRRRTVLKHFAPLATFRDAEPLDRLPSLRRSAHSGTKTYTSSSPPTCFPKARTSRMPSSSSTMTCPGTRSG